MPRARPGPKRRVIEGERDVMAAVRARLRRRGGAEALARTAGASPAFICNVRLGRRRISPRLAEALGFRLRYIRKEVGDD